MPDATAAPLDAPTDAKDTSFLTDLVEHGDKLVAADLPTDVRKVLGALISWVDAGGKFVEPEIFNPAGEQVIAEEQAESARLANRLAQVEAQLTAQAEAQAAAGVTPAPAPVAQSPTAAIPGVVQAPPEAAGDPVAQAEAALEAARAAAPPTPPASE